MGRTVPRSGQVPTTFTGEFPAITFGVVLMPLVIPWGYVWRHYVKAPGDRWRYGTSTVSTASGESSG